VITRLPRWAAWAVLVLIVLGPLYWITASSFKDREEILRSTPTLFPVHPTLANFRQLFSATDYPSYLTNSFIAALLTALFTVLVSFGAAYGLYRLRVPGSNKLAGAILVAYMIPGTLLLVPLYQAFAKVELIDTRNALVIVNVAFAAPFCTWLLRGFFFAIPRDIDEAAAVDGAGPARTMLRIVLPLVAPGIATVAVYASQLVVSDNLKTLPIGLSAIMGQYTVNWGLLMAGAVCTVIPAIIPFLFVGRWFVGGLTSGAVK
jgi:multiple sugar transport system permease protein